MTTLLKLENGETSNGDIHVVVSSGFSAPTRETLLPGEKLEKWISTGHVVTIQETWPTSKKKPDDPA